MADVTARWRVHVETADPAKVRRWELEALTDRGFVVPGATWALVQVSNYWP